MKLKNLFLIIAVLFITSCGKISDSSIPSSKTMKSNEIKELINNSYPSFLNPEIVLKDEIYIIPTVGWINGKFTPEYQNFLFNYGLQTFQDNNNDCDKFTLYAKSVANILNHHNPNGKNKGIAVGEVVLIKDTGLGLHSMLFIIVFSPPDKAPRVIFYEPQAGKIVNIIPGENSMVLRWNM